MNFLSSNPLPAILSVMLVMIVVYWGGRQVGISKVEQEYNKDYESGKVFF